MSLSLPLQGSKTQLVNQLVFFDEEKMQFLNHYFPMPGKERTRVDQVLSVYSSTVEKIVADFSEDHLHSTVLIGSQAHFRYLDDQSTESYTIVFPHQADPNQNKISFLSPIGLQLLLSKANEKYELVVPSGQIEVQIEEIKYMNCGDTLRG